MDAATLERLVREHARFPGALAELVGGTPAERLREREAEGRWSPLEVLAHLRDEEVEDFRARAMNASRGEPAAAGIDPQAWVTTRGYNALDPAFVLREFSEERARSCAWLATLDAAALARETVTPGGRRLRCADLVAAWRMHDLLHLRQLATALSILEARALAGYAFGYAGELPAPRSA